MCSGEAIHIVHCLILANLPSFLAHNNAQLHLPVKLLCHLNRQKFARLSANTILISYLGEWQISIRGNNTGWELVEYQWLL